MSLEETDPDEAFRERRRIMGAEFASARLDPDDEAVLDASARDVAGASG